VGEDRKYEDYLSAAEAEFEAICSRCGACCGAFDDPCSNLYKSNDGKYLCKSYSARLGPQVTVSGHPFNCVPIRQHIAAATLRPGCAYLKKG
jgi:hypothetical protein